jgi:hypothetical protein
VAPRQECRCQGRCTDTCTRAHRRPCVQTLTSDSRTLGVQRGGFTCQIRTTISLLNRSRAAATGLWLVIRIVVVLVVFQEMQDDTVSPAHPRHQQQRSRLGYCGVMLVACARAITTTTTSTIEILWPCRW